MAKFCQMILNQGALAGRRYVSPERVQQMTGRQTAAGIPESYGFGWTTRDALVSHNGAWKTNMTITPSAGLITIVMVQNAGWRIESEGKKIEPAFRKAALEHFAQRGPEAVARP
jgi:CubicO group peptidase (beta-lactamase class C family)